MLKKIFLLVLVMSCNSSYLLAQSESEVKALINTITSISEIDSLKEVYPDWNIDLDITPEYGISSNERVFNCSINEVLRSHYEYSDRVFYNKTLEKSKIELCRADYIYFNSKYHTKREIDSVRLVIMDRYDNGEEFSDLIKEYNEFPSGEGKLDWFYNGVMVKEFDEAIRLRKELGVYTVDVEKNNWYYVVLKKEHNRMVDCSYSVSIMVDYDKKSSR